MSGTLVGFVVPGDEGSITTGKKVNVLPRKGEEVVLNGRRHTVRAVIHRYDVLEPAVEIHLTYGQPV